MQGLAAKARFVVKIGLGNLQIIEATYLGIALAAYRIGYPCRPIRLPGDHFGFKQYDADLLAQNLFDDPHNVSLPRFYRALRPDGSNGN